MSLLDLMSRDSGWDEKKVPGVIIGIVTKVDEETARVKLKFPVLNEEDESDWARIATLMGGDGAGTFYLPEVGDEALCAFEHGDIRFPYVLGFLWGKDKPPEKKQPKRLIKSRSGNQILLDDTKDETAIVITTKGGMTIKLEDKPGTLTVQSADGMSIKMEDKDGKLTVATKGGISMKMEDKPGSLTVATNGGITMKMEDKPGSLSLATAGGMNVKMEDKPGSVTVATAGGTSVKLSDTPAGVTVATPMGVAIKWSDAPPGLTIDASAAGKVAINCLQAEVNAPAGINFNTPKATFAGMLSAMMIQTQIMQSQAVISTSYTPGAGNML